MRPFTLTTLFFALTVHGTPDHDHPQAVEVLARYPVGTDDREYRLVVGPCGAEECQVRVTLNHGTQELSSFTLATGRSPTPEEVERTRLSFGDPLDRFAGTLWEIAFESSGAPPYGVDVFPRLVKLEPDLNGLLVSQTMQTHHPFRQHRLLVADGDSVVEKWLVDDYQWGRSMDKWTSVVPVAGDEGEPIEGWRIFYLTRYNLPPYPQDTWNIRSFRWRADTREAENVSDSDSTAVYAAIVGSYPGAAEAQAAVDSLNSSNSQYCLGGFWILMSDDFPRLRPGWTIFAALSTHRDLAERKLQATEECLPGLDGYLRRAR